MLGWVCQLNYDGGGVVQHDLGGECIRRAFASSTFSPRIGQEVYFRLEAQEAVDLRAREQHRPMGLRQMERLQRDIVRFGNAVRERQSDMVLEAERLLLQLLSAPDLDGDALCRLFRRCAAWLQAPRSTGTGRKEAEVQAGERNVQWRVRKLLIELLEHLDLQDDETFKAVEGALRYVASLLQRAAELRSTQWQRLAGLLPEALRPAGAKRSEGYEKAFAGSVYVPSGKSRRLATVFQDVGGAPVVLKCSECPHLVTSRRASKGDVGCPRVAEHGVELPRALKTLAV